MKDETTAGGFKKVSRSELIDLLNQDLSREYQAIIGYVVYSQVLKGAEFVRTHTLSDAGRRFDIKMRGLTRQGGVCREAWLTEALQA